MKRLALFILVLNQYLLLFAQASDILHPNSDFGDPTPDEFAMTVYPYDSTATAIVLYKKTTVDYNWVGEDFQITYHNQKRIKILKEEGKAYANVEIPFLLSRTNRNINEAILGLEAYTYNLENGKVTRTKMKKGSVFEERLNDNYIVQKFTVPQVKVGSIIEYEYKIASNLYTQIRPWMAQEDIPVQYGEFECTIPKYFKFHLSRRGDIQFTPNIEKTKIFNIDGNFVRCPATRMLFTCDLMPAVEKDDFIWCLDNHIAQINLELLGYDFSVYSRRAITPTWGHIDDMFIHSDDFGERTRIGNPLKKEMEDLNISQLPNLEEKVKATYTLLKSKVKWNERYALLGRLPKQTLKEGTGNNADINFILINMLNDIGIKAYPVVMSRRDLPQIPYYPSLESLNTFIVGIAATDSTYIYLDGSIRDGYIDVLPPILMTNRARLINPEKCKWVDLQNIGKHAFRNSIQATIDAEGTLKGTCTNLYYGQYAAQRKESFRMAKDSITYIKEWAEHSDIQINSYTCKNMHNFTNTLTEQIDFEKRMQLVGNNMYINPLIFMHIKDSPFKQAKRELPIEFDFIETVNLNISLTIPQGFVIEELPKNFKIETSDDKSISMTYYINQKDDKINISYTFRLNKLLFPSEKYEELKKIWELTAEKNNAILVLKKL